MANGLMPLAGLGAVLLVCVGCGSEQAQIDDGDGGATAGGRAGSTSSEGGDGAVASGGGGQTSSLGGTSSGASPSAGANAAASGSAGKPSGGAETGPPPAIDGLSIYTLECHGESRDCNLATVPCLGISSSAPGVAAGWACANRCTKDSECSSAPSGAEAKASCVPFTASGHCLLVCQNEDQSFACPTGMTCYSPPKSPIGYCLWQ